MKKATACVFTILLLVLWSPLAALADAEYPLEPLDLSSPRATLKSFLTTGDALFHLIRDEFWAKTPSSVAEDRLQDYNTALERMFDLREIPPAARYDLGRDGVVYLYEVLSRIELPPEADIPDAAAFPVSEDDQKTASGAEEGDNKKTTANAKAGDDKKAGGKSVRWTIPHTEITLVRITDGPQAGQFLFSSSTVLRAEEFYKKIRTLPYKRDVPIKNYVRKRSNLNRMIAPRTVERFPAWLKRSVHQQAVWKWIGLAMLIAMAIVVTVVVHRRVLEEEPRVRFAGFGNYSLNVEIRVDIDTSDFDEFREIREDIYLRVMKIVKDAGTGFAFPSRTVYHTSDNGLDAERRQEAEANVQAWCSAQELPFPRFSAEHRKKMRNTLDYPPEGSSEESK